MEINAQTTSIKILITIIESLAYEDKDDILIECV